MPGQVESDFSYTRTVDAVADLGLDPNGGSPIDSTLSNIQTDTKVVFPDGDYLLTNSGSPIEPPENVAFVAAAGANPKIVYPGGYQGWWISITDSRNISRFMLKGIDVDQSASGASGHMHLDIFDICLIEDCDYIGRGNNSGYAFKIHGYDSTAEITLRNVNVPNGAMPHIYFDFGDPGRIGIYQSENHKEGAILWVLNCEFSEFGNNGMYASRHYGDTRVEDSYFENNGTNSVRISGDGSWAKRCEFRTDMSLYNGPTPQEVYGQSDTWGIWHFTGEHQKSAYTVAERPAKPAGLLHEDCEHYALDAGSDGRIGAAVRQDKHERSLEVRDTDIELVEDTGLLGRPPHALIRLNPESTHENWRKDQVAPPKPWWARWYNCNVIGSTPQSQAFRLFNADGSEFDNVCIEQTGSSRDAFYFDCKSGMTWSVTNSNINVTGQAFTGNCPPTTSNLTFGESCSFSTDPAPPPGESTDPSDVVEDWEDTDPLSEWSGDLAAFDVVTAPSGAIASGSNTLRKQYIDGGFHRISSTGELAEVGWGDEFRVYFYADQSAGRTIFRWGWSVTNEYNIRLRFGADEFGLYRGGTNLALDSSPGLTNDTLYYVDVTHDDGTLGGSAGDITATLHRASDDTLVSTLAANDTTVDGSKPHDYLSIDMDQLGASGQALYLDFIAKFAGGVTDAGGVVAAGVTPLTASETGSGAQTEAGTVVSTSASPLTATAGGPPTAPTNLTATMSTTPTTTGTVTTATATPLTATEAVTGSVVTSATVTATTAVPLTATETAASTDAGSVTAASATPLTSVEATVAAGTTVESWEDADPMSEWTGDTPDFSVVTSPSFAIADGSWTLRKSQTGTFSALYSHNDGLPPVGRGDTFRFYPSADQTDGRLIFRWGPSANDVYQVRLRWDLDEFGLYDSGTLITEATNVGLAADTLYYVEVTHDDGTLGGSAGDITATLHLASDDTAIQTISGDQSADGYNDYTGTYDFLEIDMDAMGSAGMALYLDYIVDL